MLGESSIRLCRDVGRIIEEKLTMIDPCDYRDIAEDTFEANFPGQRVPGNILFPLCGALSAVQDAAQRMCASLQACNDGRLLNIACKARDFGVHWAVLDFEPSLNREISNEIATAWRHDNRRVSDNLLLGTYVRLFTVASLAVMALGDHKQAIHAASKYVGNCLKYCNFTADSERCRWIRGNEGRELINYAASEADADAHMVLLEALRDNGDTDATIELAILGGWNETGTLNHMASTWWTAPPRPSERLLLAA